MKLLYKSGKIKDPEIQLVDNIWRKINEMSLYAYSHYIIKMDDTLYNILCAQMMNHDIPVMVKGIECIIDNKIENGVYCIYRRAREKKKDIKPSDIIKWAIGTKEGKEWYRREVSQWCDAMAKDMKKQLFGEDN